MTASRTIRRLLLAFGAAGICLATGARAIDADRGVDPPVTHTVIDRTESVLGKDLVASGKKVGPIVDVLADKDGHVRAVVIDCGGFLGIGARKVAVAWPDLRFNSDSPNTVTTDVPGERLAAAPEVKSGRPVVVVTARNQPRNQAQNGVSQK